MSSVVGKEKSKVFETVLSSPGMSEKCKIVLNVSRQNIILLARLIEAGILTDQSKVEDEIIRNLEKEGKEEFKIIHEEILKRSDLTEFYEKLKML